MEIFLSNFKEYLIFFSLILKSISTVLETILKTFKWKLSIKLQ